MCNLRIAFVIFSLLMLLNSCTVKSYEGPELPKEKIATVTVRTTGQATIQSVMIDEKVHTGLGDVFQVLPGEHSISLNYRFEDKGSCSDDDHFCFVDIEYGVCSGQFKTVAGRDYLVTLESYYALIRANVLAKGYLDFTVRDDEKDLGSLACRSAR